MIVVLVLFLILNNYKILNPLYYDWLYFSGDTATEAVGWNYFLKSDLVQWPPAANDSYAFPWGGSALYSPIATILGIPIKFLFFWYPGVFQILGLQLFLGMYLFAFFSYKIFSLFTKNTSLIFLQTLMLLISPFYLFHLSYPHYTHFSGLWVIPASILLYLNNFKSLKFSAIKWATLIIISVSWFPYLVLFVLTPLGSILINLVIKKRFTRKNFGYISLILFLSLIISVGINGISLSSDALDSGLGYCNANLNSFVNPYSTNKASWSSIIPDFRYATDCQHEGFGFLGIGTFILLSIFTYFILKKGRRYFCEIVTTIKKHGVFITCNVLLFGLALGFNLTLGDKLIYDFNDRTSMFELFSTFRSSGKYIALSAALITIFLLIVTQKFMSNKKSKFL